MGHFSSLIIQPWVSVVILVNHASWKVSCAQMQRDSRGVIKMG